MEDGIPKQGKYLANLGKRSMTVMRPLSFCGEWKIFSINQ